MPVSTAPQGLEATGRALGLLPALTRLALGASNAETVSAQRAPGPAGVGPGPGGSAVAAGAWQIDDCSIYEPHQVAALLLGLRAANGLGRTSLGGWLELHLCNDSVPAEFGALGEQLAWWDDVCIHLYVVSTGTYPEAAEALLARGGGVLKELHLSGPRDALGGGSLVEPLLRCVKGRGRS
jgi:hypothetical protein